MRFPLRLLWLLALALLIAGGCSSSEQNDVETSPPEGWQADGGRWWQTGADTAKAFRDLSSVQAMGVVSGSPPSYAMRAANLSDEQLAWTAKQSLEKLYRKAPETVDSLFEEYIRPTLARVPRRGDLRKRIEALRDSSHKVLTSRHFRLAARKARLGQDDLPVGYPDSLFNQGIGGNVQMQVYISAEGVPQALELLSGTHPVLDRTALRAMTQMRWEPAYVKDGSYGWKPIPSWTWANVNFGQSSS